LFVAFLQDAIVGCWLVFLVFWAITALRTKRTVETRPIGARLTYALPTLLGAWLIFKGTAALHQLGDRVLPHEAAIAAVCLTIVLAGLALALWRGSPWAATGAGRSPSRRATS
jgi:hypothetical protein